MKLLFRSSRTALVLAVCLLPGTLLQQAVAENDCKLTSPDGRIVVSIQMPRSGSADRPTWSVAFRGKPILTGCELGLETADASDLLTGVRALKQSEKSVSERIPVLFGKSDHADNNFAEIRFSLESPRRQKLDIVFRAYNDAVALRYQLPKDAKHESITISDETTSFGVAGDPKAYAQYLENYKTSHEHNVTTVSCGNIPTNTLLDMPLTLSWADGTCAAITEASLRHYAGMSLMRASTDAAPVRLTCKLTPHPDGNKVVRPLPLETPWRVVVIE